MNGVHIYNNTIYSDQKMYIIPGGGTYRGLIDIYSNTDITTSAASTGTKIKNNIFYTVHQIYNINVLDAASLKDFESDFNVFYCEAGTPIFKYLGATKTFAQWQALGYDLHSTVVDPNFINRIDFVPKARLNYGTNLGSNWQTGLSTSATWVVGSSPTTANQNGNWQVGARVYETIPVLEITISGLNDSAISTDNGTIQLQASILPTDATTQTVTWSVVDLTGKATISNSGLLTAEKNGTVKAIATATDGSGMKGELTITISNQVILIENLTIIDDLINDTIKGIGTKLKLKVVVTPQNATNISVIWNVENITGQANIDQNGELTTISSGKINVIADALDGSKRSDKKEYIIAIPVLLQQHNYLENIRIFPNPTSGKIKIHFEKLPSDGVEIEIRNPLGQTFIRKQIYENISEWQLEKYPFSIYFVTIIDKDKSTTHKIINGIAPK